MANFNTNQTRHLYVATAIDANVDTIGDIAVKSVESGEFFFSYKNADGIIVRSDTIKPENVVSLKKTTADQMATPLMMQTVTVDSGLTLSSYVGKAFDLTITIQHYGDFNPNSTRTFVASVVGDASNTASATAFHKALAIAIAKAMPKGDEGYPYFKVFSNGSEVTRNTAASDVTGSASGVVLVQAPQKWVRGKLTGEPVPFIVSSKLSVSNDEDIAWAGVVSAVSNISNNTVIPANHVLADLEYFSLGERGEYGRGLSAKYSEEPAYLINPASGKYSCLSIEYFWAGGAENVQKSPRLIQVVAPETVSDDIVSTLYTTVQAAISGSGSGSGSGA